MQYYYNIKQYYPFIEIFFFKIKFIEMLLNSDIHKKNCSNNFTISKGNKLN